MKHWPITTRIVRTLVALTLVLFPLRPIYGDLEGMPRVAADHHLAGPSHADAVSGHAAQPLQVEPGSAEPCHHDSCQADPLCDGNCLSCAFGAVLVVSDPRVETITPVLHAATAAAIIEIILSTDTHPPQTSG